MTIKELIADLLDYDMEARIKINIEDLSLLNDQYGEFNIEQDEMNLGRQENVHINLKLDNEMVMGKEDLDELYYLIGEANERAEDLQLQLEEANNIIVDLETELYNS